MTLREEPGLQLLGLAARAGAVAPGTARVVAGIRAGEVAFAVVAEDLTATGRAKLVPLLEREGVRHAVRFTRAQLGRAVGKSPLAAVGVADAGFGDRLAALLGDG
ncbi:MAG: L7Ae/L30e/S12e/Gadd45 family ribosomal protein [Longimicrobiales bacterium]